MSRAPATLGSSDRYTFRGNVAETRHGWLRLTPAYSVHLVRELLEDVDPSSGPVLDPFCGTGTTLLACAERGLDSATIDLNPFLVWLASAKTAGYGEASRSDATRIVGRMRRAAISRRGPRPPVPPIHRIEKWWSPAALDALARAHAAIDGDREKPPKRARDLALLVLCRTLIAVANVSFGHQSMSFKKAKRAVSHAEVAETLSRAFDEIGAAAASKLRRSRRRVHLGDSRRVDRVVDGARFGTVLTSPPYSNRMSYIRELRPYMYWLGYLVDKKDAGDLDWRAIGGTWGTATSSLAHWRPNEKRSVPFDGFDRIVGRISDRQPLLGRYVQKYFEDMVEHCAGLFRVVIRGGRVQYVVGNSKFYDVLLPAQEIFAALFEDAGFTNPRITTLRKRTSKKELYEYLVEAHRP